MKFKDILKDNKDKGIVVLGKRDDELLKVDINNYPSIIITGETGTGKSILLDEILLQMITKYTSEELRLVLIDSTGVELNYYKDTNHHLLSAMNDNDKAIEVLGKVLEEIDRRKSILLEYNLTDINEYNEKYNHKVPKLLVAIDDVSSLLSMEDVDGMIKKIISSADNLNIMICIATNNVYSKLFKKDDNLLASILISFDTASEDEAVISNMPFSNDLLTGKFIIYKDNDYEEYKDLKFDDDLIKEIID